MRDVIHPNLSHMKGCPNTSFFISTTSTLSAGNVAMHCMVTLILFGEKTKYASFAGDHSFVQEMSLIIAIGTHLPYQWFM